MSDIGAYYDRHNEQAKWIAHLLEQAKAREPQNYELIARLKKELEQARYVGD